MHSLTAITAFFLITVAAAAGVPPHGDPHRNTNRPITSTASYSSRVRSTTSHGSLRTISATIRPNPTKVQAAAEAAGPTSMTMTVINLAGVPVSTKHGFNDDAVLPTIGMPPPSMMSPGAQHSYVLPLGFGGNLHVSKAGFLGDESLSEYSFVDQNGTNTVAINVSYVTGFTVNIDCVCSDGRHLSGCAELLWDHPELCKEKTSEGACKNPLRGHNGVATFGPPDAFFAACEHKAYVYTEDHLAQANGWCVTGDMTCKILPGSSN